MKKMLMVSYYAPPLLNAESILVAKTLKFLSQHFEIDLLTVTQDSDFKEDAFLMEEMGERVRVIRMPNPKPQSRVMRKLYREGMNRLFHIDNPLWLLRAQKAIAGLQGPYDVLYSRSMPGASHVAALAAQAKFGMPWVAQFSDPWGNNPYHPYSGRKQQVISGYERQVVEGASRLVFPTVEIRDLYAAHYPQANIAERSLVLPHHFDEQLYGTTAGDGKKGRVRLAYIGDFYGLRSPEPLVKGLTLLKERRPDLVAQLELQVVGNVEGKFHPSLQEAEKQLGMTVARVGQVPFRKSLELMAETDILLLVDAPSDVNLFLSSKLIDYLGARRPILGITSTKGTAGRVLTDYGWNVHHPDDVPGIAAALESYLSHLPEYQERARELDVDRYRSEQVVAQLAALCEDAIEYKRSAR
ncbi:MAG: glycosyltransferase [Tumebacillaceae bacterium]